MRKFERRSSLNTTCGGTAIRGSAAHGGFFDDIVSNFLIVYMLAAP